MQEKSVGLLMIGNMGQNMPKKTAKDTTREILSHLAPEYFLELAEEIHAIANAFYNDNLNNKELDDVAFLICKFANRHAESLSKIKKKFKGYIDVLKQNPED